jgi:lysophospholipase L1-like esterase
MNRKFAALVMASALALVAALPAFPATPAAADEENTVYLGLGDSYAYGWGASNPQISGYVPRFYHFLRGDPYGRARELVNLGYGGETSTSFITGVLPGHPVRTPQLDVALATIMDADTDTSVVTLDIGGNDLLVLLAPGGPCSQYPPTQACFEAAQQALTTFVGNYSYILGSIAYALGSDPDGASFMVMTYANPWSGTGSGYEGLAAMFLLGTDGTIDCANQGGWGMNDIIACVPQNPAFGGTIEVVDIYPSFLGRGLELTHIAEGDIHPNNHGYALIASLFRDAYRDR